MNTDDLSQTTAENSGDTPTQTEPEAFLPEPEPSLADGAPPPASETAPEEAPAEAADEPLDDLPDDEPFLAHLPQSQGYDLMGQDFDIDAALAAVAELSDTTAEQEATQDSDYDAAYPVTETPVFLLPTPPAVTLRRGAPASLVPALILIITGSLLTLATTSGTALPTPLIAFGVLAAVALLMLGYWLSAGRWARGAFFLALLLLLSAAAMVAVVQPGGLGASGAPLFIVTTGAALMLTALMSRPRTRRALLPGFLMVVGGGVGLGFTLGIFNPALLTTAAQYAWVVPVILLSLWLLPLIFRRRA
jgi:hypothetical protein